MRQKFCRYCGEVFQYERSTALYCSDSCRQLFNEGHQSKIVLTASRVERAALNLDKIIRDSYTGHVRDNAADISASTDYTRHLLDVIDQMIGSLKDE